ncbi:MAG: hypothetical protein ACKVOB_09855 [Sphingomonas sp.]
MTTPRSTARLIFGICAGYGILLLIPLFFAELVLTAQGVTLGQPEFFYGFVGTALACQLLYVAIARDPVRFRPVMLVAVAAKLGFGVPVALLFSAQRVDATTFGLGLVDIAMAAAFLFAWRITRLA